ncbi:hypothetical protein DAT1711_24080 [Enterococcus cecorum]
MNNQNKKDQLSFLLIVLCIIVIFFCLILIYYDISQHFDWLLNF